MPAFPLRIRNVSSFIPFIGLLLFALAVWALSRELASYRLQDILAGLRKIPVEQMAIALLLTFLSYLDMTLYDALGVRYVGRPLPYRRTALAGFVGYAFSNNIGFGMLAGGSIRYRLYTAWGLSGVEIAEILAFCGIGLWSGFFILGGGVFLALPPDLTQISKFSFISPRWIGFICIGIVIGYLFVYGRSRQTIQLGAWEFPRPAIKLQGMLIGVALLDWSLAGSVLYVLLPATAPISWVGFLGFFLLAQTAGVVSQVPGGVGVFETAMVLLMSPLVPSADMLGVLLAYRGIYYIAPLFAATLLLGSRELLHSKVRIGKLASGLEQWMAVLVPPVLGFTTFIAGAVLLFSGVLPTVPRRMQWLHLLLPLPVMEISHFLGSLTGAMLILLARSIQRRVDAAYPLTVALLGAGVLASLLKGFDYEEALVLSGMLASLLPCRRYFYRKGSLLEDRYRSGWIVAVLIVLVCATALGFFSYKHVEYTNDLWWRFAIHGDAPRFLRAMVGVGVVLLTFMVAHLLKSSPASPRAPEASSLVLAATVIEQSPDTSANLAFLGDKSFLFSPERDAFIMYGVEGRSWIAMGDPVGARNAWPDLIWRFKELADTYGGWTVFYEVGKENLHLYLDLGLNLMKLGEEARVPLGDFTLEGSKRKALRYTLRHLGKDGFQFRIVQPSGIPALMPALREISDAWLKTKHTKEKRFSLGCFDESYLQRFPAAVVQKDQTLFAFANIWESGGQTELSMDLMRHLPKAPPGIMEYLTLQLMLWGKQNGYQWFNLGMAPLSGMEDHSPAPLWQRMSAFVFRHGEHFYNLQGLRQYKEKFDPVWEPRYLAAPGGFSLPRVLINVTTLISGGLKGAITK